MEIMEIVMPSNCAGTGRSLFSLLEVFSIPSLHLIMRRPQSTDSPSVPPTGGLSLEKEIVVRVVDDRSEDADLDGLTEAQGRSLWFKRPTSRHRW